jgi:hypothetical protein
VCLTPEAPVDRLESPMNASLAHVQRMLDESTAFEDIETYIEGRSDLSSEAKSALWLYAWTEVDQSHRRQVVHEMLAHIERPMD